MKQLKKKKVRSRRNITLVTFFKWHVRFSFWDILFNFVNSSGQDKFINVLSMVEYTPFHETKTKVAYIYFCYKLQMYFSMLSANAAISACWGLTRCVSLVLLENVVGGSLLVLAPVPGDLQMPGNSFCEFVQVSTYQRFRATFWPENSTLKILAHRPKAMNQYFIKQSGLM